MRRWRNFVYFSNEKIIRDSAVVTRKGIGKASTVFIAQHCWLVHVIWLTCPLCGSISNVSLLNISSLDLCHKHKLIYLHFFCIEMKYLKLLLYMNFVDCKICYICSNAF